MGVDISSWRLRIGVFLQRGPKWKFRCPVLVLNGSFVGLAMRATLFIAIVLLLSGDVEQNPGPVLDRAEQSVKSSSQTRVQEKPHAVKPFYYKQQLSLSQRLLQRITFILSKPSNSTKKSLDDFDQFEFYIFTARYKTLRDQTAARLADPESHCFSSFHYSTSHDIKEDASKRVLMFDARGASQCKELKERVKKEPNTFFLIIADEAHWGITLKTGKDEPGSINQILNIWNETEHPNVFILQVSATPYNLLTTNSRLSPEKIIHDPLTGLVTPEEGTNSNYKTRENVNEKMKTGTRHDLHVVKWSEWLAPQLNQGLVMRLQMSDGDNIFTLCIRENDTGDELMSFKGVEEEQVDQDKRKRFKYDFLFKGPNENSIQIFTPDYKYMLVVLENGEVGFVNRAHELTIIADTFMIETGFGEDIFELYFYLRNSKLSLQLCQVFKQVRTRVQPVIGVKSAFPLHDILYSFVVIMRREPEQKEYGSKYISLNNYIHSMKSKHRKNRLIRSDPCYDRLRLGAKRLTFTLPIEAHEILLAEYYFYILNIQLYRDWDPKTFFLNDFSDLDDPFIQKKKKRNDRFLACLNKEGQHQTSLISPDIFKRYIVLLQQRTLTNFEKKIKAWQHDPTAPCDSVYKLLIECWLYLEQESLKAILELVVKDSRLVKGIHKLKRKLSNWKQKVLLKSETYCIVDELVSKSHVVKNGHMKVIRVKEKTHGDAFYTSLKLVRNFCHEYPFEVLRHYDKHELLGDRSVEISKFLQPRDQCEYEDNITNENCPCINYTTEEGKLKCNGCGHVHRRISTYADLDGLACILILVDKGRMGDTFPRSFNTLDLRLEPGSSKTLASFVQEIGRLCHYGSFNNRMNMPYALVGFALEQKLLESGKKHAPYYSSFKKIDRYRRGNKPTKSSFDFGNKSKHLHRILLDAEPQIGKTGTYLALIKNIRQIIDKEKDFLDIDDSNYKYPEISPRETDVNDDASYWQYPHWKNMEELGKIKTTYTASKYDKIWGKYEHGKEPERTLLEPKEDNKQKESTKKEPFIKYRSYHSGHFCPNCKTDATAFTAWYQVAAGYDKVRVSVPSLNRYNIVRKKMKIGKYEDEDSCIDSRPAELATWIFTPSYDRATTASVNLAHAMVDIQTSADGAVKETPCNYVQILVVRETDFRDYCKKWQNTHAIIELPEKMPGCEKSVSEGGVGYARLFVQRLAEELNLDRIFMLDDNIIHMRELETKMENGKEVLKLEGPSRYLEYKDQSFYNVLHHLESQFDNSGKLPDNNFELLNETVDGLYRYTGHRDRYGAIGIFNHNQYIHLMKKPFNRRYICACVLINIQVLKMKKVAYKPWPAREDLNLCDDAEERNLWICKYTRFLFKKGYSVPWIPKMVKWDQKTILPTAEEQPGLNDSCGAHGHMTKWINSSVKPKRCEVWRSSPESSGVTIMVQKFKRTDSNRHLVAIVPSEEQADDAESLANFIKQYLRNTSGIGGFREHILILPTEAAVQCELRSCSSLREFLTNGLFEKEAEVSVFTTHRVDTYKVPFIVIQVSGTIFEPKDTDQTGNATETRHNEREVEDKKRKSDTSTKTSRGQKRKSENVPRNPRKKIKQNKISDRQFLLSLLPELTSLSSEKKQSVKSQMRTLLTEAKEAEQTLVSEVAPSTGGVEKLN